MFPFAIAFFFESGTLADASYAYVTVSPIMWLGMFLIGLVLGGRGRLEKWAAALSIIYLFMSFLSIRLG